MENTKTLYNHIVEVEDRLNSHIKTAGESVREIESIKAINQAQNQSISQNQQSIQSLNSSLGEINTELQGCEKLSNKTTALSQDSTNSEYPSAKCVYDAVPQMINSTGTSLKNGMTQNIITYLLGQKLNSSTYESAGGNINVNSWKTTLGINNVSNLKIAYGTGVYAGGNPMVIETGLTTVYSFVATVCKNTTDVIPPCFCLLHRISGSKAYFSMRLTSTGGLVPTNQNNFYWIAVGV